MSSEEEIQAVEKEEVTKEKTKPEANESKEEKSEKSPVTEKAKKPSKKGVATGLDIPAPSI